MQLTKEQLLEIKAFVEKRGFAYLDVQLEILDHVASAVEEKMNNDSKLSFETALTSTHAGFGVLGFSVIESGVVKMLSKKYGRLFWENCKIVLRLKYVLIPIFVVFGIYKLQEIVTNRLQFMSILIFCLIILAFIRVVFSFKGRGYKKLMSYKISSTYMPLAGMCLVYLNIFVGRVDDIFLLGLNINFLISAVVLSLFMVYIFASVKTGLKGFQDSKSLMDKYNLLYG